MWATPVRLVSKRKADHPDRTAGLDAVFCLSHRARSRQHSHADPCVWLGCQRYCHGRLAKVGRLLVIWNNKLTEAWLPSLLSGSCLASLKQVAYPCVSCLVSSVLHMSRSSRCIAESQSPSSLPTTTAGLNNPFAWPFGTRPMVWARSSRPCCRMPSAQFRARPSSHGGSCSSSLACSQSSRLPSCGGCYRPTSSGASS